ncbi:MAG: hypothetical protein HQM00_00845 [Magnetococcales bacterium]|nr:hypothetical protein [Magnetococcales bacterium]
MISVRVGGSPDLARQGRARHKLFVEGHGDGLDVEALKIFLPMIDIEPMGPAHHLKSVATALHPHHADYYFLVDRDHHDDQTVENSWKNFPDTSRSNLLIWRKREFENYFLDPDYLQKSQWLKSTYKGKTGKAKLEQKILNFANQRIFMDVVNRVILKVREDQKNTWIDLFSNPDKCKDKEMAKEALLGLETFQKRSKDVSDSVNGCNLEKLFEEFFEELSGGCVPLSFGRGRWIDHMSGKELLTQTINNCFQVKDSEGREVEEGKIVIVEVVKDLMRLGIESQPRDFQELYRLIDQRTLGA